MVGEYVGDDVVLKPLKQLREACWFCDDKDEDSNDEAKNKYQQQDEDDDDQEDDEPWRERSWELKMKCSGCGIPMCYLCWSNNWLQQCKEVCLLPLLLCLSACLLLYLTFDCSSPGAESTRAIPCVQ